MENTEVLDTALARVAAHSDRLTSTLLDPVREFQSLQHPDGSVTDGHDRATQLLLKEILPSYRESLNSLSLSLEACDAAYADVEEWLKEGLDHPPRFDETQAAYGPPRDGEATLFLGPLVATNGPAPRGHFLECFIAARDEPSEVEQVQETLPHPKYGCQSMRLLGGTQGLMRGNCIVFFPENIASSRPPTAMATSFAEFFFNKFYDIYHGQTIPRLRSLTGGIDLASEKLSEDEMYRARAVWGYLHDHNHYQGPRPWDESANTKMSFFPGLLEEIKCDCEVVRQCRDYKVPFADEIIEMVLLERLFRYPGQPDAPNNFDAGTGLLLHEWLCEEAPSALQVGNSGGARIDVTRCAEALRGLIDSILHLELRDKGVYVSEAERFVYQYVPKGEQGRRLGTPSRYSGYEELLQRPGLLEFAGIRPSE